MPVVSPIESPVAQPAVGPAVTGSAIRSIPGLEFHVRGNQGITLNGADVAAWADVSSGNGRRAVQGSATLQPLYVANARNGIPGINTQGTEYLTVADFAYGLTGWTGFAVLSPRTTPSANPAAMAHWDTGAGQRSWDFVLTNVSSNHRFGVLLSQNGTFDAGQRKQYSGSTNLATGTFYALTARWSGATNVLELYVNGVRETETKTQDDNITTLHNSTAAISLGCALNSGAALGVLNMIAPELGFYSRFVTDGELALVHAELRALYNL